MVFQSDQSIYFQSGYCGNDNKFLRGNVRPRPSLHKRSFFEWAVHKITPVPRKSSASALVSASLRLNATSIEAHDSTQPGNHMPTRRFLFLFTLPHGVPLMSSSLKSLEKQEEERVEAQTRDEIDLYSFHEKRAGRLVIDPEEARIEFGDAVASRLKLSRDGSKVLWPQPHDSDLDPQNWSDLKKNFLLFIVTLAAIVPDFDSGIGIASIFALAQQYDTTTGVINNLTSKSLGPGGLTAIIFVKRFGRLPVLFWSQVRLRRFIAIANFLIPQKVLAFSFLIGATFAPDLNTFTAMRCLTAFFGTAPQVTGLYIVTDLFPFHIQARKLNIWTMGFIVSPFLSPFLLGFLVARHNWRWAYGVGCFYSAIVVFMITFFMEETLYDRTLQPVPPRPTSGLRYRIETLVGITGVKMAKYRATWADAVSGPLQVIWRPHVWTVLIFEGAIFGFGIGINVTNAVFLGEAPPVGYGFSADIIAGFYATPIVSVIIGELLGRYMNDWIMNVSIRRNKGVFEAESRLWACYVAIPLFICGFLVLGAAFQKHLSVGAIIMGWAIAELGVMINTVAVYAYLNDCFPKHQGEVSALINLARTLGGFAVAYFQVPWAAKNGALQTFGVEAAIVTGLFLLVVPWLQLKGTGVRLVSLEPVPEYDPTLLTLPSDPYTTLSHIHDFESLTPFQEKITTTQDALHLIKSTIASSKGPPRSERLSWSKDAWDGSDHRLDCVVTRRALRKTPVVGRLGGVRRSSGKRTDNAGSYARLLASQSVSLKTVSVEPITDRQVNENQVLDVLYSLKAEDHALMRAFLQSVATMCRPRPATAKDIKKDFRRAYVPAGFVFNSETEPSPPDSPPLTPIFPRNARFKLSGNQGNQSGGGDAGLPRSFAEIPRLVGAEPQSRVLSWDDNLLSGSGDEIAGASMVIVDGWQTFAVSSPSTVSSIDDEQFDELADDLYPSSPDTSVVNAINFVEDVENSKLDEILIPKERCIGGNLGMPRESIDRARKAGGLGAFLSPLLHPSHANPSTSASLHPLWHEKMSRLAQAQPKVIKLNKESRTAPSLADAPEDSNSLRVETSAVSTVGGACCEQDDSEIRGLYVDLSHPGERRLGPPLPREPPDPKELIRTEPLYDEQPNVDKKNELSLHLMLVPTLAEPNANVRQNAHSYADLLATPTENQAQKETNLSSAMSPVSPLQFMKTTKGLAPLRVALSWVPFTRTAPIPVHAGLLQNDIEGVEAHKDAVDVLLQMVSTENDTVNSNRFDDENFWRKCNDHNYCDLGDGLGDETVKIGLILTRKERKALSARENGTSGMGTSNVPPVDMDREDGENIEAQDVSIPRGSGLSEIAPSRPSDVWTRTYQRVDDDVDNRPTKRPRLSYDDSGIDLMLEQQDVAFLDQHRDQGDLFNANRMQDDRYSDLAQDLTVEPCGITMIGQDCASFDADALVLPADVTPAHERRTVLGSPQCLPDGFQHHSSETQNTYFDMLCDQNGLRYQQQDLNIATGHNLHPESRSYPGEASRVSHLVESVLERLVSREDKQAAEPFDEVSTEVSKLELASHALGIQTFAQLRAKRITPAVLNVDPIEPLVALAHERISRPQDFTAPVEVYDNKTVRKPSCGLQPQAVHKYLASLDLLQKRVLVQSFASGECLVELVERSSLAGADLIIDPHTAVIFTCLLSLPAHAAMLIERLSQQSWRYQRILVVFEGYPESKSWKQHQKLNEPLPQLNAYTPPILKAIKRFRRDLNIQEGCGKKSSACDIWCAFADSVNEAATYARLFGDEAERADTTGGALWENRDWLDLDESEDEMDLVSLQGMNCFSAAVILCQMKLQAFLDMTPDERLELLGPLVGMDTMTICNMDIAQRIGVVSEE
ncbi:hypothetical protein H0H93_010001 [Arthromyces matolae]|nr:hypothetical protein H0H93_010001 [Arthromyces matolae]